MATTFKVSRSRQEISKYDRHGRTVVAQCNKLRECATWFESISLTGALEASLVSGRRLMTRTGCDTDVHHESACHRVGSVQKSESGSCEHMYANHLESPILSNSFWSLCGLEVRGSSFPLPAWVFFSAHPNHESRCLWSCRPSSVVHGLWLLLCAFDRIPPALFLARQETLWCILLGC